MKKILFFIISFFSSLSITFAANNIYNINISVYIDEEGNADIEEVWDVKGSDGTEWYKVLSNLGNSKLSNYEVYMDGSPLTYKKWNVNESLIAKKGYYGINKGNELCFGKYDFQRHTFTLKYTLSNFIFNVSDAQVIYFNFIDKLSNVNFDSFSLEISTYYDIPNTLDVWGYGYKGYAYVEDGKIKMSNKKDMDNKYVVLLAKFPLNTYNTDNSYYKFKTFDDVYKTAEKGAKTEFKLPVWSIGLIFIISILIIELLIAFNPKIFLYGSLVVITVFMKTIWPIILIVICEFISRSYNNPKVKYPYLNGKKIKKKTTPYFRDIPCHKDIYLANTLLYLNGFQSNNSNIMGAIFLKWIKEGILEVFNEDKKVKLILKSASSLNDPNELKLYEIISKASQDGILEEKELKKWCKKHPGAYMNVFDSIRINMIKRLTQAGYITLNSKGKSALGEYIYEESLKLYGLKLFLDDFSNINDKEVIALGNWQEYLMFAYLFGNAKKVMKQFKNLYPEIIDDMNKYNISSNAISKISYLSRSTYKIARTRQERINYFSNRTNSRSYRSYSSGGGGRSRSGGGRSSFGGGGGGSR